MKEFEVGEEVYVNYGVESYVFGEIIKIMKIDNRISIKVNRHTITTTTNYVFYDVPKDRKDFFLN